MIRLAFGILRYGMEVYGNHWIVTPVVERSCRTVALPNAAHVGSAGRIADDGFDAEHLDAAGGRL